MLTFTLLMQLGMAIAIAQHKKFYIVRSPHIYHRYGDGGAQIYVELGTGSPILYSYGDPIHRDRGPQTYEGVSISTIDMGIGVPKIGCPHIHMTPEFHGSVSSAVQCSYAREWPLSDPESHGLVSPVVQCSFTRDRPLSDPCLRSLSAFSSTTICRIGFDASAFLSFLRIS